MSHRGRRFLVVGCGSIGLRHARNLLELGAGEVIGFDLREDRRQAAQELGLEAVGDLEEAWSLAPEAVVVAVPTSLHVPVAREAVARGCHILVEKPLSDSLAGAEELIREADERGVVGLVGCNMRFHPGVAALRRIVDDGEIGRVLAVRAEAGQYLPDWRPQEDYRQTYSARRELGGGIVLDAIHELDYVSWLLGTVERVGCMAGRLSGLEIDTEDVAAIMLGFDGALAEVHVDYVQRAYARGCKLIGEEGTAEWSWGAGAVRVYRAERAAWDSLPLPEGWEPNAMYLDELRHFLRCLDGDEEPMLDLAGGLAVLRVALAARLAAEEDRVVDPRLLGSSGARA